MLSSFWYDVRYSARRLSRSPGLAATAIVTIALGVGLNTGIFSVVNGVLFRGIPAPDAHELVSVYQTIEGGSAREGQAFIGYFSTSEYRTYRDGTQTLSGLLGHTEPWEAALGGDAPQEVIGTLVTCNYFEVLRQPPALGRAPTARECEPGADPIVVLGHEIWTNVFASDPAIVGRTVELNRQLLTVIGVAREGTYTGILYESAFFAPISVQPFLRPDQNIYGNDQNSSLALVGRRNSGISVDQVRAELGVIAAQIDREQPGRSTTLSADRATPLSVPGFRSVAVGVGAVLMGAFGLVLLVACANVANLLLARALLRSREIAVRLSLGASRARIVRQLLTESVLLAIAGGVLGSLLALWSFRALLALALSKIWPEGFPPLMLDTSPDLRVLSFTLLLSFGTAIVFGLVPALQASRPDLHAAMKQDSSGAAGRRGGRLQGTLVGAQVAMCMMLMLGAGLLIRGLYAANTLDPDFAYRGVVAASYDLESVGYDDQRAGAFQRRLLEQVQNTPGVDSAAFAWQAPLNTGTVPAPFRLPGQSENEAKVAQLNAVAPGYFSLLGIPIVRGRAFTDDELANDALVAIVTETTARNFWPERDPLGEALFNSMGMEFRVVGVAKDAQVSTLGVIDPYYVYLPAASRFLPFLGLLIKSRMDFGSTATAIRAAVRALDPAVAVRIGTLEDNLARERNLAGLVTGLAASLGALALVLAAVGIYGVVSYFVGQRFREIGIRIALGARPRAVLGLILRQTLRPVVVGAVLGVAGAVAAGGILSSVLFGVSPADPIGLGGAAAFVVCVALAAGGLAGRRALRLDPMVTLRQE